jgi:hypothetical protein
MAEILVKATNATHLDPVKDARGCFKRGMPVALVNDGHQWGSAEALPHFVILKFPLVDKSKLLKYLNSWPENRIRRWQIRWADLPLAARNKLLSNGELIIKATLIYTDQFDYTWSQIKEYFRNLETGIDETEDVI